jgi:ribonuclease HI
VSTNQHSIDQVQEIAVAISGLQPAEKQRLFDLLVERGDLPQQLAGYSSMPTQLDLVPDTPDDSWSPDYVLVFDGGSKGNPGLGYGSYEITRVLDGARRLERLDFGDGYTSNEAEYDTLNAALGDLLGRIEQAGRQAREFRLEVRGDSALVINQLQGRWKAREPRMRERRDRCRQLLSHFGAVQLVAQPRAESVRILGH